MTRVNDNNTVAGLPELRHEPRCKVCQLVTDHPGILKLLHEFKRDEPEMGEYALHTKMRPIFERHGIKGPSSRAIGRHLAQHVDFTIVPPVVAKFDLPDPDVVMFERMAEAEQQLRSFSAADVALGANDSDYHSMADLFRRLMRRISALDADPKAFMNPDGRHSMQKLNTWASMVNTAKSVIEGLNKMRNSDRMTVSILEQHTKRYAAAVASPLASTLRDVRDELMFIEDPKAKELAQRLTLLLSEEVSGIFTDAAKKSLGETRERYKLLN